MISLTFPKCLLSLDCTSLYNFINIRKNYTNYTKYTQNIFKGYKKSNLRRINHVKTAGNLFLRINKHKNIFLRLNTDLCDYIFSLLDFSLPNMYLPPNVAAIPFRPPFLSITCPYAVNLSPISFCTPKPY